MNWKEPKIQIQNFEPNEYVAVCWGVSCDTDAANGVEQDWTLPGGQSNYDNGQTHRSEHCGTIGHQWITSNNDNIAESMSEIGTDGLGTLACTIYTDKSYNTIRNISTVEAGNYIYWTTTSGGRVWHHQGWVTETTPGHPNRS